MSSLKILRAIFRYNSIATAFILCALGVSPAHSVIISTGDVTPAGLGPGDTTITEPLTVGFNATGILDIDGGSTLEVNQFDGRVGVGSLNDPSKINITDSGTLRVLGERTLMNVGFSGSGVVNVNTGGSIDGPQFLTIGSGGGNGTVNLDGPNSTISLKGICPDAPGSCAGTGPGVGPIVTIGSLGTGELNITNGAKLILDPLDTANIGATSTTASDGTSLVATGLLLGGDEVVGFGGNGTLNIDGAGSEVLVKGNEAFLLAGRADGGRGTINVTDGGKFIIENPDGQALVLLGDVPNSGAGRLTVDGTGSLFDAGSFLGVGADQAQADAGDGRITLVADDPLVAATGGTVKASAIAVGAGAVIEGTGTLMGNVVVERGTISPGLSLGEIFIDGNFTVQQGSTLVLEANSLTDLDIIRVAGDVLFGGGTMNVVLGFVPGPQDVLNFFDVLGTFTTLDSFEGINAFAAPGSDVPLGTMVTVALGELLIETEVTEFVPAPATLALFGLGLAGLGWSRRKKA